MEPHFVRTQLCLSAQQTARMFNAQERCAPTPRPPSLGRSLLTKSSALCKRATAAKDNEAGMEIMREAHAKLHGSLGAEQSYYFLSYRKALSQSGAGDGLDPKITEAIEKRHYEAMKIEMAMRMILEEQRWELCNYYRRPKGAAGPGDRCPDPEEEVQRPREPTLVDFYSNASKAAREKLVPKPGTPAESGGKPAGNVPAHPGLRQAMAPPQPEPEGKPGKGVEKGDTVTVFFTGKLKNGAVFDSNKDGKKPPLTFPVGRGRVLPGFDAAVLGMVPGQSKTVTLSPEEGYGER